MIRYTIAFALVLIAGDLARGQVTISYTGSVGESNVVNSLGQAIDGDTVSIGTFTNGFDPSANATDLLALQNHWATFDSTTTRLLFGLDGRFAATSPAVNNTLFDNQKIYLFITEPGVSGITEYGLFSSTNPSWVFPATGNGTLPPDAISSDEVNQFYFGNGILSQSGNPQTPGSLQTQPITVPEPGAAALLSIGLATLALRRRRAH